MAGLYLHIPFCAQKCHYCDFFSSPPQPGQLATWHLLLQQNLRQVAAGQRTELDSLFFGGGTPSLLSVAQIQSLLDCCRTLFPLSADAEISLEANPGTLTPESLAGYHAAGINRLSLGIQSFNDRALQLLGRKHSAAEAVHAFSNARAAGFNNISIDLIFALPEQTPREIEDEVATLITLAPDHVGIYGLTIETGTRLEQMLSNGQISETGDEAYAKLYLLISRLLTSAGYEHYEISNFSRPGYRCRHNQGYWQRKTCLAAGAGAHSFNASGNGQRSAIPDDLALYQQNLAAGQDPAIVLETFDQKQAMAETAYLALRTAEGLDARAFTEKFGISPEQAFPEAFLRLASHLKHRDTHYYFTIEDWLIYDHLISNFL